MASNIADFWDRTDAFITAAQAECSCMVAGGRLNEFERKWHDPVALVQDSTWFALAKPVARRVAAKSIRAEVKNMIEYYRFAEGLLA